MPMSMPSLSFRILKRFKSTKLCIVKFVLSSHDSLSETVSSLDLLHPKGIRLPSRVLASLLRQCSNTRSYKEGKLVHLHLKLTGFKRPTTFLANHLICMYFRCGDYVQARKVFDKMEVRNLYSWNNMLSGYVKLGMMKQARRLFSQMPDKDYVSWNTMVVGYAHSGRFGQALWFYGQLRRLSIGYNEFSFSSVLIVCVKLRDFELCRQIHAQVLVVGFSSNVVISTSIVDAYAKCGKMEDARRFFDDMSLKDIPAWTALVSGYAIWGNMELAAEVFSQMPQKNSYSWTSLICGYARNGLGHEALGVFRKMIKYQVRPDQFTFSSCLSACATIASLKHGKQIHSFLVRNNIRPNTIVVSAIVDMYSKCGSMEMAWRVFNFSGNKQDVVLWNTMVSALAQYGNGIEATMMLNDMIKSGVKPNRATFVVILNACSHSGLVQEGLQFFNSMTSKHGVVPDQEHYACLFDLLGQVACCIESVKDLQLTTCKPGDHVWNSSLGVCRKHGNIELGREVAAFLIKLQPQSSAAYVLLSSIYAALGKWGLVEKVRHIMDERRGSQDRAISWIEIENKVHAFTVSDGSHLPKKTMYSALGHLSNQMEDNVPLPNSEM
ncbi:pentatricopeptide repeat-containing protein At2g21090 [Gastrolobium bilobum]|uniref:pentatricopeptide repeat-containing protein At2g21090 n=1 Tax=Gastrolobium bilobum TaxID=150636 RepID=UPI002AAF27EA|nr:pentatricopeptide repeat-containing protein At2g21090 [Gastrolobium bilobum]